MSYLKIFFIIIGGSILIFMPKSWMTFGERWKYKDEVETSDLSFTITRITGLVIFLVGFFNFLYRIMT